MASGAVPRSDVTATVGLLVITTVNANVTCLTPGSGPGVADEPVLLSIVLAIAYKHDGVINVRVHLVASVEDAAVIGVPVAGINRYGNWSNSCNSVNELSVVVLCKLNET